MAPTGCQSDSLRDVRCKLINSLLVLSIKESIPGMEDAQIVDILYVAFLELRVDAELLACEVEGVQCLSLGFGDGRDLCAARESAEPNEIATAVLQRYSLGRLVGGWEEM